MFQNIQELKDFIVWAKQQKLQEFRIGECHVQISQIALLEATDTAVLERSLKVPSTEEPESDDEYLKTLFHSVEG